MAEFSGVSFLPESWSEVRTESWTVVLSDLCHFTFVLIRSSLFLVYFMGKPNTALYLNTHLDFACLGNAGGHTLLLCYLSQGSWEHGSSWLMTPNHWPSSMYLVRRVSRVKLFGCHIWNMDLNKELKSLGCHWVPIPVLPKVTDCLSFSCLCLYKF